MALNNRAAIDLAGDLETEARTEWGRLRKFVRYARGKQPLPWLPDYVESEYRDIARKSASNWLDLVIRAVVQGLRVDNYTDVSGGQMVWTDAWQANGMDARQLAHHRSIFTCGYGYLITLPAGDVDGAPDGRVWMRPESATAMWADYDDPNDEWPKSALRIISKNRWELYDDEARYTMTGEGAARKVTRFEHGLGVTPVAQMRASLDLLGPPMGEVEPVMSIQDRIVDATFTLQMVAKYGAFPQRWIAGLNPGEPLRDADGEVLTDSDGNPVMPKIKAYVDHILMAADHDTKFGQFAAADLKQYVDALEAHIRHLAAITQTPPHYLLGSLVNLSAEALAAAESGLQRKIAEKQTVLGEGYEQSLRLSASILGDNEAANDTSSRVHWQDVESRSLAQTSDALLKLSQLGVPVEMLMRMIPGWSKDDIDEASKMIREGGALESLFRELENGLTVPEEPVGVV